MARYFNGKEVELLAPAGTFEIFKTVIDANCDAVYFGGPSLNMRMMRKGYNLSYEEVKEAVHLAHERGKRAYITVNNLMDEEDLKVVARHEWTESMTQQLGQKEKLSDDKQAARLSHEEFINTPILEQYQPMDIEGIMDMMDRHPDIYIVTDTKEQEDQDIQHLFTEIVSAANERNPGLLDRVVIQIYNEPMLDMVMDIYPFESIIYTLYATQDSPTEITAFVQENNIDAVTMPEYKVSPNFVAKLRQAGAVTYVHTINDTTTVNNYEKWGVYGVYSDLLTEPELEQNSLRYTIKK